MVKKKPAAWNDSVQTSARTVYVDDSSPEGKDRTNKRLTGSKFLETLPLITSGDLKSGRDEGVQIIPEELRTSSLEGSALSKTFEDYRHNL